MASARPQKKVLLSHLLKVWSPHLQISFYSQWIGCQQSCFAYHSKCLRFAQVLATHMRSFFLPRCSSRVSIFTRHWHMPGPWKPTWVAQQLASKVCGGFEFWKQFGVRRMGSNLGNPPKNRREEFFEMVEDMKFTSGILTHPWLPGEDWSAGHGTEVGLHSPNRKVPTIPSTFQPSHG